MYGLPAFTGPPFALNNPPKIQPKKPPRPPFSCFSPENFGADKSNFRLLREVFQTSYSPSVLLYGTGKNTSLIPEIEKEFVREQNCVLDIMNTGAACRTFNVLCAEDRRVAAVLFPVD